LKTSGFVVVAITSGNLTLTKPEVLPRAAGSMNIHEQQAHNRRRTWLVMAMFVGFLAFLGAGLDLFLFRDDLFLPIGTTAALAIGAGQSWWSLQNGDRAVLRSSAAVLIGDRLAEAKTDDERLRYRQFENIVEEMAIASGLPKPKAYVIADDDPNAFATGRDPDHASIAVTEGLLRRLTREELQGVVAHEMAHVRNLDIRLMTVVAALIGATLLLSDWAGRAMRFGGGSSRSKRSKNGNSGGLGAIVLVVWILAVILAPFIGRLLATAVSRRREYLADATGAELTRQPLALAGALEKIEGVAGPTPSVKRGTAHMCIADPLGLKIDDQEGTWANLWATHPPMAKRIAALRAMGYRA
jgi:heat shock protein HtpX